jgi:GTP cyclohydrolase I
MMSLPLTDLLDGGDHRDAPAPIRRTPRVDRAAASAALERFLIAIGRDPAADPNLRGTAARVVDAYVDELCSGYAVDAVALLRDHAIEGASALVVLRDLPVTTMCPHHLLPATGVATVAFAPDGRLVGLGTLARVVDAFAHRLTLQEDIGERVVEALCTALAPQWAGCSLSLSHGCVTSRGERRHGARVQTVALGGALDGAARLGALRVLGADR